MSKQKGKVYLVGAGPGDPGLITVKGLRCLEKADLVVYDRLMDPALLEAAPQSAQRLFVGKERGRQAMTQQEINDLLVQRATAGDVVGMVVRQGMAVAGVGVIAGLVGAYWLTSFMSSLLYETSAHDPVTFLVVPVILALVALAATLLPARRAVAVEPSRALREG